MSKNKSAKNQDIDYVKSNLIIDAQYKTSLLVNKIMAISLANADKFKEDENGHLISEFKAIDLVHALLPNAKEASGSFYDELNNAAFKMTGCKVGYNDRGRRTFSYNTLIIKTSYEDSIFRIYWNGDFKNELMDIGNKYTQFRLDTILRFKTAYALRLYELLRSRCFERYAKRDAADEYEARFSVGELKLKLGVVDSEDKAVQDVMKKKGNAAYDAAVAAAKKHPYETWRDFQSKVLAPAVKEINETAGDIPESGIRVSYTITRSGIGGKTSEVIFSIHHNANNYAESDTTGERSEKDKEDAYSLILEKVDKRLTFPEIKRIAEAAGYDQKKIRDAVEILSKTPDVNNIVGFLIQAIKESYSLPIKGGKKNTWDFEQHNNYDINALESAFVEH